MFSLLCQSALQGAFEHLTRHLIKRCTLASSARGGTTADIGSLRLTFPSCPIALDHLELDEDGINKTYLAPSNAPIRLVSCVVEKVRGVVAIFPPAEGYIECLDVRIVITMWPSILESHAPSEQLNQSNAHKQATSEAGTGETSSPMDTLMKWAAHKNKVFLKNVRVSIVMPAMNLSPVVAPTYSVSELLARPPAGSMEACLFLPFAALEDLTDFTTSNDGSFVKKMYIHSLQVSMKPFHGYGSEDAGVAYSRSLHGRRFYADADIVLQTRSLPQWLSSLTLADAESSEQRPRTETDHASDEGATGRDQPPSMPHAMSQHAVTVSIRYIATEPNATILNVEGQIPRVQVMCPVALLHRVSKLSEAMSGSGARFDDRSNQESHLSESNTSASGGIFRLHIGVLQACLVPGAMSSAQRLRWWSNFNEAPSRQHERKSNAPSTPGHMYRLLVNNLKCQVFTGHCVYGTVAARTTGSFSFQHEGSPLPQPMQVVREAFRGYSVMATASATLIVVEEDQSHFLKELCPLLRLQAADAGSVGSTAQPHQCLRVLLRRTNVATVKDLTHRGWALTVGKGSVTSHESRDEPTSREPPRMVWDSADMTHICIDVPGSLELTLDVDAIKRATCAMANSVATPLGESDLQSNAAVPGATTSPFTLRKKRTLAQQGVSFASVASYQSVATAESPESSADEEDGGGFGTPRSRSEDSTGASPAVQSSTVGGDDQNLAGPPSPERNPDGIASWMVRDDKESRMRTHSFAAHSMLQVEIRVPHLRFVSEIPVSHRPAGDIYGPATVRMIQHLRERAYFLSRTTDHRPPSPDNDESPAADDRLLMLPRSLVFDVRGLVLYVAPDQSPLVRLPLAATIAQGHRAAAPPAAPSSPSCTAGRDTAVEVTLSSALLSVWRRDDASILVPLVRIDSGSGLDELDAAGGVLRTQSSTAAAFPHKSEPRHWAMCITVTIPSVHRDSPTPRDRFTGKTLTQVAEIVQSATSTYGVEGSSSATTRHSLLRRADTAVDVDIRQASISALRQDDFLYLIFAVLELSEMAPAAPAVPASTNEADALTDLLNPDGRETFVKTTAIQVHIRQAHASLRAPRLSAAGFPIGEVLWSLLDPGDRDAVDEFLARHEYVLRVNNASVFVVNGDVAGAGTAMSLQCGLHSFVLGEHLPSNPPQDTSVFASSHASSGPNWGDTTVLLHSYTRVHCRAFDKDAAARRPDVVRVSLTRLVDRVTLLDTMQISADIERVALVHAACHSGDLWVQVLMSFFTADAPPVSADIISIREQAAQRRLKKTAMETKDDRYDKNPIHRSDDADDGDNGEAIFYPYATETSFSVSLKDLCVVYTPWGSENLCLVGFLPAVALHTDQPIRGGSSTTSLTITIPNDVSLLMNNRFIGGDRLLEFDIDERLEDLITPEDGRAHLASRMSGNGDASAAAAAESNEKMAPTGGLGERSGSHGFSESNLPNLSASPGSSGSSSASARAPKGGRKSGTRTGSVTFGLSRRGFVEDLKSMGFVLLVTLGPHAPTFSTSQAAPATARGGAHRTAHIPKPSMKAGTVNVQIDTVKDKRMFVSVTGFKVDVAVAADSMALLVDVFQRQISQADAIHYLPLPEQLVAASGLLNVHVPFATIIEGTTIRDDDDENPELTDHHEATLPEVKTEGVPGFVVVRFTPAPTGDGSRTAYRQTIESVLARGMYHGSRAVTAASPDLLLSSVAQPLSIDVSRIDDDYVVDFSAEPIVGWYAPESLIWPSGTKDADSIAAFSWIDPALSHRNDDPGRPRPRKWRASFLEQRQCDANGITATAMHFVLQRHKRSSAAEGSDGRPLLPSQYRQLQPRQRAALTSGLPIDFELRLNEVSVFVELHSGVDFGSRLPHPGSFGGGLSGVSTPTAATVDGFDALGEYVDLLYSIDGSQILRQRRLNNDHVTVQLTGLSLQYDVFQMNIERQFAVAVALRDIAMEDHLAIESSQVLRMLSMQRDLKHRFLPAFTMEVIGSHASRAAAGPSTTATTDIQAAVRLLPLRLMVSAAAVDLVHQLVTPTMTVLSRRSDVEIENERRTNGAGMPSRHPGSPHNRGEDDDVVVVDADEDVTEEEDDEDGGTSTSSQVPSVFINRLVIHPTEILLSYFPRTKNLRPWMDLALSSMSAARRSPSPHDHRREDAYAAHVWPLADLVPAIENSLLIVDGMRIQNATLDELPSRIMEQWKGLSASRLLLLLGGIQMVHPAAEVAKEAHQFSLVPVDALRRNKSLMKAVMIGLRTFSSGVVAEALKTAASVTHAAHVGTHASAGQMQPGPHAEQKYWADQPSGIGQGVKRGASAITTGTVGFWNAIQVTAAEQGVSGVLFTLPTTLAIPVDAVFRGLTDVLLGARNAIAPRHRADDRGYFKTPPAAAK